MKKIVSMRNRVNEYLDYRRSLGYELIIPGKQLLRFADYADNIKFHGPITEELMVKWAKSSKKSSRFTWATRLEILRGFAKYCSINDPRTEVPTKGIFGSPSRRITPYIYSKKEIHLLLNAIKSLYVCCSLRSTSLYYLFAFLCATGLRISEVLALKIDDVDLSQGLLHVQKVKFSKSRLIPLHKSVTQALLKYCKVRRKYFPDNKIKYFFIDDTGVAITYRFVKQSFNRARSSLGWNKTSSDRPRIYDVRHTFVCNRLIGWYRKGVDISTAIPYLSTYLGHVNIGKTYWYITGIPKLMNIVAKKFEKYND